MNGTGDGFMTTFISKKFGTMTLESKFTEDGLNTVNIRISFKASYKKSSQLQSRQFELPIGGWLG